MSLWDDLKKCNIIGDGSLLPKSDECAGMFPRDFESDPIGGNGFAAAWDRPTIPESEWRSLAEKKKRQRSRLIDMIEDLKWFPGHQARTNWCWANAVTMAAELMDVATGQKWERLSAGSLAMPIVGGNFGGYITRALAMAAKDGIATDATWATNSLSQRKDTAASLASRQRNRIESWVDMPSRSLSHLATCLLQDNPVPVPGGFNWMSHAVTAVDISYESGVWIVTYANSGLYRDRNGYTRLSGQRAIPDSQLAPLAVTRE